MNIRDTPVTRHKFEAFEILRLYINLMKINLGLLKRHMMGPRSHDFVSIVCRLAKYPMRFKVVQDILPTTYYWTVPLILDHSYSVGKLKSSKIADTKVSGF
jgi:hypothetical protein